MVSDSFIPIVERLKSIGYDGVECLIGSSDKMAYRRFGEHTMSLDLETTCVFVVGKDEYPVDESARIRSRGLDRANDLNAKIVCGPFLKFSERTIKSPIWI